MIMWNWDSRTHQFIVANALQKCRSSFANLLKTHQELFILGIEAPDRIFRDFTNHYYNCTPNQYGVHSGSVIKKIDREITMIHQMLQNPDTIILHPNIAPFLKNLLDTPLKAFVFELGVVSHYIADLHQPMHTDGKYRFEDEETVHKILEADTRLHLDELTITTSRRRRITDPIGYFTFQIYEINDFYIEIIDRYYLRPGKVKPERWENSVKIVEECLSAATMNIANVYLDFESASQIFRDQKKYAELMQKVTNKTSYKTRYHILKYKSGTVSLRAERSKI